MLIERRKLARTRVVQPAKVLVNADTSYDCVVDNLNMVGACVIFHDADIADLPRYFELTFDHFHTSWVCDVVWKNETGHKVGVTWKLGNSPRSARLPDLAKICKFLSWSGYGGVARPMDLERQTAPSMASAPPLQAVQPDDLGFRDVSCADEEAALPVGPSE